MRILCGKFLGGGSCVFYGGVVGMRGEIDGCLWGLGVFVGVVGVVVGFLKLFCSRSDLILISLSDLILIRRSGLILIRGVLAVSY